MKKISIRFFVSDFYAKIIHNKHTLLYKRLTIHSIQRYNGLYELTQMFYTHSYDIRRRIHMFCITTIAVIFCLCFSYTLLYNVDNTVEIQIPHFKTKNNNKSIVMAVTKFLLTIGTLEKKH